MAMPEKYLLLYTTSTAMKNWECTEYAGSRCIHGTYDRYAVKVYAKCNQPAYTSIVKEIYMNEFVHYMKTTGKMWMSQGLHKTLLSSLKEKKAFLLKNMPRMVANYMFVKIYGKAMVKEMISVSLVYQGFTYQFIVKDKFIEKASY